MPSARVLFLCTGNSCRSQMAEGWLRHLAGDRFQAFSAGLLPTAVNPLAVRVMAEAGVDISRQTSKDVSIFTGQIFQYVITVCDRANGSCPIFPGPSTRLHWPTDDPAEAKGGEEERLPVFRRVRDELRGRIATFLEAHASAPDPSRT